MGTHTVKQGDTLWDIAKANNVTVDDLVQWNNISDPNLINVGQVIKLSADGGSPTGGSNTTNNTTGSTFKYDDFQYGDYQESDAVTQANAALQAQLAQKPGEYSSQWQAQLDETINKILNREKFSYDLNGDALYQQYKDKYIQQGKMAMGDAIGQASAMTGGYGNSYAQSVGQQMYQKELQNLNDIVPELYQMAYDKYNQEGQDLYNQYAMLGDRENTDYGRYRDTVSDWKTERDYLAGRYDSERNLDYSKYADDRTFKYGKYADDKSYAYQEHRNAIEDALAFDAIYGNSSSGEGSGGSGSDSGGSGSGSGSGSDGNETTTTHNYDTIDAECAEALNPSDPDKEKKTESWVSEYLRAAWKAGHLTDDEYEALKNKYVSLTDHQYTTGSGGRYTR